MQCHISTSLPFYRDRFRQQHGLGFYSNPFMPTVFFGCYSSEDWFRLAYHRGLAVLVWAGSDILQVLKNPGREVFSAARQSNVRHVAISDYMAADLDQLGLPYTRLPLCCVDQRAFSPVARQSADGVFVFLPRGDEAKYGGEVVSEAMRLAPEFRWVIHDTRDANADAMREKYGRCFVGVRPLAHDGLSNTVVELGLMGRRCVWNGGSPNAIPWQTAADIVAAIRHERAARDDHREVASAMREFLTLPPSWRDPRSYVEREAVLA